MRWDLLAVVGLCATMVSACVSTETHKETLKQLEASQEGADQTSKAFDAYKRGSVAQVDALKEEQSRLAKDLLAAQRKAEEATTELESTRYRLQREQQILREAQSQVENITEQYREEQRGRTETEAERNLLRDTVEGMEHRLDKMTGLLSETQKSLDGARSEVSQLREEEARLSNELLHAQSLGTEIERELESTRATLAREQRERQEAAQKVAKLEEHLQRNTELGTEIRRERDSLRNRNQDISRRLETAQQELTSSNKALETAHTRIDELEQKSERAVAALGEAQQQSRMLEAALAAEAAKVTGLQDDKQRLLTGTSTAQEEIARLQRRAGELESEAARAEELHTQLQARDQEIGMLRQAVSDRETLAAQLALLNEELDGAKQRIGELTGELASLSEDATQTGQERDALLAQVSALTDELSSARQRIATVEGELSVLTEQMAHAREERERLTTRATALTGEAERSRQQRDVLTEQAMALTGQLEQSKDRITSLSEDLSTLRERLGAVQQEREALTAQLMDLQVERSRLEQERASREADYRVLAQSKADLSESLKVQEDERVRLEREREAKEAEIARLTEAREHLTRSLKEEIEQGHIRIQQVRDRLRINMVDRVLFDSGQATIKPDGVHVLDRVSSVLRNVDDKVIRIEGHTDTVPIGPKIADRFPTNWELSTARATSVVRYLIEKGDIEASRLSAVGYAYNRPVASNETPEGRAKNRRIEIILYPKDLSEIARFESAKAQPS